MGRIGWWVVNETATLVGGAAALAGATGLVSAGLLTLRRPHRYLSAGHALAGLESDHPLPDVLRRGLGGMTVPVTPGPRGELFLGAGAPQPGRTLRGLVLAPLFVHARTHGGRIAADQQVPFRLVVEFIGRNRDADTLLRAYRMLNQQLRDHAGLLSHCQDGELVAGAVSVSVAGIVDVRELLAAQRVRYAFVDGVREDIGSAGAPANLVPIISEKWTRWFGWDGREPIPAEERHLLHDLVNSAHDDGRILRISGLPKGTHQARSAIWTELDSAGVDVIADADQAGLARFLRRHSPTAAAPVGGPIRFSQPRAGTMQPQPARPR